MEEATFLETKKDGEVLVLLDGRKLDVNPGDIPNVICWTPTAPVEISEDEVGDRVFNVIVRNTGNNEEIRGRWK